MPIARFQMPDGRVARFEVPEGTTPEQAHAMITAQVGGGTEAPSALDGMGTLDKMVAGVGKAFVDVGRGVGQMIPVRRNGQWDTLVTNDDIKEARKLDAPLMGTTAGKVGNFAGSLAALAPTAMIPGANTLAGASLIGAGAGLAQPSLSPTETALNVGLGAAGGAGGQWLAGKIGGMVQRGNAQTAGQKAAAAEGERLGFTLTPGQASGSKSLQRVEAALEANPMTSRPFDMLREGNQRQLNTLAAKAIGEKGDNLASDVLGKAEARLGSVFDKVADKTPVPLDPQRLAPRVQQVLADSEGLIGGNGSLADHALFKRLDDFVSSQGGATREQLRSLSSKMGKAARNNMTTANGDRELGAALFQLKGIVDSEVMGTLQGSARQEFADALKQYGTMMNLTARGNVVNPSSGNVNGRALASLLQQKDKGGFTFGKNSSDLYSAARFTQAFPEVVGNSGTATRSLGAADYLASLPLSLASRAYLSAPSRAMFNTVPSGTMGLLGLASREPIAIPAGALAGIGAGGLLGSYLGQ